jgi:NAD(P)-dependent dehydrogenase (short-subunit alcohol dehydrogenase family)
MGMLDGAVALVTGAGGGIGSATARLLAEDGAAVGLLDLRAEAAEAVAHELSRKGTRALALKADVRDEQAVQAAVARLVAEFGRLDVVVNNAGVAQQGTVRGSTVEQWRRVLDVNLLGTFLVTQQAAEAMTGGGAIVNVASVAALMAVPGAGAYAAAKGGVVAFTRVAAAELAPTIRVNCVCPGTVLTDMPLELLRERGDGDATVGAAITAKKYLLGRLGQPDEIAQTVLFLASPRSSFMTGTILVADGGVTAQ